MLHLIPAPLHRVLYRIADAGRRRWWRVRRPRRNSAVVIAFDDLDRVLLVRHSYGCPTWSLPGGAMKRGEQPEQAAAREFAEELGCALSDLTAIDTREVRVAGSRDTQHVFIAQVAGQPVPDMREIVAVVFADPQGLPEPCGQRTRQRIEQAVAHRRSPGSEQR